MKSSAGRTVFTVVCVLMMAAAAFAQAGARPAGQARAPRAAQAKPAATGSLRGTVADQTGAVIPGADLILTAADGTVRKAQSGADGTYSFDNVPAGVYTLQVASTGFATYQANKVDITAARRSLLEIGLKIATETQKVDVVSEPPISIEPENNASAIVLKEKDLEALPDDPDDLQSVLQAMAGPSAGPNGAQFFIDGFTGSQLPPKESIREIRINQNPFSSEYDRLGFGRIEILTKPGMDKLRGGLFFNFNDQALNSRNPFASNKPDFQSRQFGGNVGGALLKNRVSFFVAVHRREIDDNAVIHAQILDSNLNPTTFSQAVLTPHRFTNIMPRFDFKLTDKHTLTLSYQWEESSNTNAGIGDLTLPSRAFNTTSREQTVRATETAVLSPRVINETRFQYMRPTNTQTGDNTIASIIVQGAFSGGGPAVGIGYSNTNRYELTNITSRATSRHSMKFGFRVRGGSDDNYSANNFAGSWVFAGGLAPEFDAGNQAVTDSSGNPVMISIDSLERYRRTLLFQQLGFTGAQIMALGGGPTQFQISGGIPDAKVTQWDAGVFAQDDWRVRPTLMLSLGLRYETQTNISDHGDFAPRVSFAWSPTHNGQPTKTVVRGGFGVFYDRFSQNLVLQSIRLDGLHQQQYLATSRTDPSVLALYPTVPSLAELQALAVPQNTRRIASDLRAPYSLIEAISVERQLPKNFTLTTTYIRTRGVHVLRSRDINAPLPGTITVDNPNGVRPLGDIGNVFEYESSGILNQQQLMVQSNNRISRNITLFATYAYGHANSDTDGAGSLPADSYNLRPEYGRSSLDVRHRAFIGGSISFKRGITLFPFIIARSGQPFNITTGQDLNGDGSFAERPALATDLSSPSVFVTRFGNFDTNPQPGAVLIPRNYAQGPAFFSINLRLAKTFGFGSRSGGGMAAQGGRPGGPRGGPMMRGPMVMGGGGHGHGGGFHGGPGGPWGGNSDYRYNVTFSIQAQNVLNRTNASTPIGQLNSPLFGESTGISSGFGFGGGNSSAANRRLELQLRFNF